MRRSFGLLKLLLALHKATPRSRFKFPLCVLVKLWLDKEDTMGLFLEEMLVDIYIYSSIMMLR